MASFNNLFNTLKNAASSTQEGSITVFVDSIKDINTSGGQCSWCGRYGHNRGVCPLLK